MHDLHNFRTDRQAPLVHHPHPDHRKKRRYDQHIAKENPIERQVKFARRRRAGLGLKIIDP